MKGIVKRILSAALAFAVLLAAQTAYALPDDALQTEADSTEQVTEYTAPEPWQNKVYLRSGMRAATLTPGLDYCVEDTSDSALAAELPEIIEQVKEWGMNTVLLNTDYEDKCYYSTELNSGTSVLGTSIDRCREAGLSVFVVLDVNKLIERLSEQGIDLKNGFCAAVHKFVIKYACDGILLTNYYTQDCSEAYSQYMRSGSGIGYENWLYETNEFVVRSISEVIRRTNNSVAVGLMINDMWANASSNELGSQTADTIQALYNGFSDTKKYVEKRYADFVMVKAYGSTSDYSLNFDSVVSWWYDLAQANGAKVYVMHLNERIGTNNWYEDQLLRQLTVLEDYSEIGGSAFNSYASLKADPLGTTQTLMKYFAEQINTETIFENLEMISPTSLSFVTYDSTVKFMGTFDENFDVYFDGNRIKLNEAGNFYFNEPLDIGWNTFTIQHKGKQYRYDIERRIDVMRSVEDTGDVIVEGGTQLILSAVAYSGAAVTATIGGQTIKLKEKQGGSEELDANSSYAKFVGYYTVGEGIVGQQQYLGDILYSASFSGYSESIEGGTVTIEAKPEPPKDIQPQIIEDQSEAGTGEVVGTMAPIVTSAENVRYIKVLENYTNVYDAKTTGAVPSPMFFQLPAGTLDYIKSESGGYITTTSGKRFKAGDVRTFTDTGIGDNKLFVKAIGNTGGRSYIKIHLDYKTSFNIITPVDYHEDLDGSFGVENYNADKVYITFDNITSVTKLPSFSACALFSDGKWEIVEENGVPKFRLALTLTQAGIYSGCGAYYDANGDLMLTFSVPTNSLVGKVIVLDPGHGYAETREKLDPGAIGNVTEQSVNLAVAKLLEQKLAAMGATVVRLKTESELYITDQRPTIARTYGADMFISIHCNSSTNTSANGTEAYYFTSYSQPLARYVTNELAAFLKNDVYRDGESHSRGDKYSYYWVTLQQDFPSILVEMGFISNEKECMAMADAANQDKMAQAIANGVYSYFARSNIAYAGNGSEDAEDRQDDNPPEPPVPTEPTEPTEETDETEESEETAEQSTETEETNDAPSETEETGESNENGGGIRVE